MDAYFEKLECLLMETGLSDYPSLIFNMDETGFALDPKHSKIVGARGTKMSFQFLVGQRGRSQ